MNHGSKAVPLYVRSHDVARWLELNVATWPVGASIHLKEAIEGAALALVSEIALALSFPERRSLHRTAADESALRLRVLLRLAADVGRLAPAQLRFVLSEIDVMGRMLGGWSRAARIRRDDRRAGSMSCDELVVGQDQYPGARPMSSPPV